MPCGCHVGVTSVRGYPCARGGFLLDNRAAILVPMAPLRRSPLALLLALCGSALPTVGPGCGSSQRGDAPSPPRVLAEARVDPCEQAGADANRVLEPFDRELEDAASSAPDLESDRQGWAAMTEPLRRCIPAGRGAWMLFPTEASVEWRDAQPGERNEDVARWSLSRVSWQLTYLAPDGTRSFGGEDEQLLTESFSFGVSTRLTVASVFDYDGDGVSELILRWHMECHEDCSSPRYWFWTFADGRVSNYSPAADVRVDEIVDHDGDGRPDILSVFDYWHSSYPCGMEPPEQGLPPVLFHSQPDGSFSASSAVATAFLRSHCPEPPQGDFGIRREQDELVALTRIACARLWGASASEARDRILDEWARLTETEQDQPCGQELSNFLEHAAVEPPARLR